MKKSKTTTKARTTRRIASKLEPPIDLQMIGRIAFSSDIGADGIASRLARFDAAALAAIAKRTRGGSEHDMYDDVDSLRDCETQKRIALAAIEHWFASGQSGEKFTTPRQAAQDILCDIEFEMQEAAFGFGLCVGYRLTRAMSGGAR